MQRSPNFDIATPNSRALFWGRSVLRDESQASFMRYQILWHLCLADLRSGRFRDALGNNATEDSQRKVRPLCVHREIQSEYGEGAMLSSLRRISRSICSSIPTRRQ